MSDSITISAADAERVTAGLPFVVDGDDAASFSSHDFDPPAVWMEAAKACPTCHGVGRWDAGQAWRDCGRCHGTGRTVVELWTTLGIETGWAARKLGLFTIQVAQMIDGMDPPLDGPHFRYWSELGGGQWTGHHVNIEDGFDLPPGAEVGMYAVIATRVGT